MLFSEFMCELLLDTLSFIWSSKNVSATICEEDAENPNHCLSQCVQHIDSLEKVLCGGSIPQLKSENEEEEKW